MADVKWFKVTTNVFDDKKIRLIESMPDGDTILIIWFKMLALTAESNANGLILLTKNMPYTDEMLCTYMNRKDTTVRMALDTFRKFGMIEDIDAQGILISNWNKHQNVAGLEKIKEQNRIRQRRYRENQRLLLDTKEQEKKEDTKIIDNRAYNVDSDVMRNVTPKKKRFIKPTLQQLNDYRLEKNLIVDNDKFMDYYESNGWKVGKNAMKDWKAAMRNWARNNKDKPKKQEELKFTN